MDTRTAYKIFMKHQLEFGIDEGIIKGITYNDIPGVLLEFENDYEFHKRMAEFLNEELER